jgi:hypothetical protein
MTYVLSNPSPPLFLSIVCCASAWLLIAGFVWSLWLALCDGTRHLKKLHQIP